jgi:hypothetical protein
VTEIVNWGWNRKMVGAKGFELELLCGRPSPQAKSRPSSARDLDQNKMVGAKGFEPSTSWSRTRK